jgi:glycosyltransferase involved in cell wall biosynthesis
MRAELESLACGLGIEGRVTFCGWLLEHADIFSDLDVTCLSSFNEGLPVCLVESLAAGVPVVATDVGGVRDIVEPATDGELVKSGEVEAFAEALGRAARERRRLVSARSAAVRAKYSTARMVASIEAIYEELLERRTFTPSATAALQPSARSISLAVPEARN